MQVGSMGSVRFSVSSSKVKTFHDFRREGAPRMAMHERIGNKAVAEYVAPGTEEVTMEILLSASRGVSPQRELQTLRTMRDEGELFPVFIGGRPLSQNKWYIKDINENVQFWTMMGHIQSVTVSLTLAECGSVRGSV